nr:AAA family ATPase [uncultured Serratia sp.]
MGYVINENSLPFSLENAHHNYMDESARIEFNFSNKNKIILHLPSDGGLYAYCETSGAVIKTPSNFKKEFPYFLQAIPVLGPLEQEEKIVSDDTVKKNIGTPRASRNFRNYWNKNPQGFENFRDMLEKTWPGMSIKVPEVTSALERRLVMFCTENRHDREIFWAGFGFQIWCQILTYLSRDDKYDLVIIDEPEVYLHPDIQRQLLGLLRDMDSDVLIATHSVEILGEAEPSEILLIDKKYKSAKRLRDIEGVQSALECIGSVQNITLTQLARTQRILFVEGMKDFKIIRRFAKVAGYQEISSGTDITAFESGGFSSWERVRSLAWGIKNTFGADFKISAVYDHDYWCDEEIEDKSSQLNDVLSFAHIHKKKEIENYLLNIDVLQRAFEKNLLDRERRNGINYVLKKSIKDVLYEITERQKNDTQSQYVTKYQTYHKTISPHLDISTLVSSALLSFENKWKDIHMRMDIVCGKVILKELREYLSENYQTSLTDAKIIEEFKKNEIPMDMIELINKLEDFRTV